MRILSALERQDFATIDAYGVFTIDWEKVDRARYLRMIGKKYIEMIRAWSKSAQHGVRVDAAMPLPVYAVCPHCHQPIVLVAPETPRR